jgi:hypothetical protein
VDGEGHWGDLGEWLLWSLALGAIKKVVWQSEIPRVKDHSTKYSKYLAITLHFDKNRPPSKGVFEATIDRVLLFNCLYHFRLPA